MNGLLEYVLESSICLTLMWVFYELVLKRDTSHGRNRYYLLGSMLFSAGVPLLNIETGSSVTLLPPGGIVSVILPELAVTPSGPYGIAPLLPELLPWLYLSGVLISLLIMTAGSLRLIKMIVSGRHNDNIILVDSESTVCFSAFGHIFINSFVAPADALRMINHEKKHIRLGHHSDLVITAAITALQWFNPAAWLMRGSLQAVHEYEADSECISGGEDALSYQSLLLSSVFRCPAPLLSTTFSKRSLLKNRIIMMTKKRTGSSASLKMILAIPLAVALILMFSCKDRGENRKEAAPAEKAAPAGAQADAPDEIFMVVEQMPTFRNDTTGGELIQWLGQNIKYPADAAARGIQGKVLVQFVVDEQGNITDPEVVRGVDPLLNKAALEVISACPQWSPGMQGGKTVKVRMTLPISFALK